MQSKYKKIILISAFIIVVTLVSTPLVRIGNFSENYETPLSDKDILSVDEINSFLEVYVDYKTTKLPESIVSLSLQNEADFSPQVKRWFFAKGWSADRFFATEQKIKNLITIATLRNNLTNNSELANKKNISAGIAEIIKQQENQLKQFKYNEDELKLIEDNLNYISQFFNDN